MKRIFLICALLSVVFGASAQKKVNPWPMAELMKAPAYEMSDTEDDVRKVVFESIDYRGNKKKVFAYYASPGTLTLDQSLDENLPAVVCVHGGGGAAFAEWAKLWAKRGYAAIAMDLHGKSDDKKVQLEGGYVKRKESYVATVEDQNEDWFFNAVADVVAAHSVLLSLDEVDKSKTAITGISWGGIITSLVSGLDPRFKVAVPVYGCGYLYQTGAMAGQIEKDGERTVNRWKTMYDPSLYVVDSKIPTLFVNGTNDFHFYTNQWNETVSLNPKAERCMILRMPHGHKSGWTNPTIYSFVDYHLGLGEPLPSAKFTKLKCKKGVLSCTIKDAPSDVKVFLCATESADVNNKAEWTKTPVETSGTNVKVAVDEKFTQWYLAVEYANGEGYSSEIFFKGGDNKLFNK